MMPAATLSVIVEVQKIANATRHIRGLDDDLQKTARTAGTATKELESTGKRGSKSLGLLKGAAGALGGVVAFSALSKGVGIAVDEFEEARRVGALTESTIKATGGAANITADQVGALATSISKKVGIDDEAIQSGANLLLTFKNVRNETGKGRDIFNQATKAAVDLSAAGFGSLESTSKQLGKALNDPIKGMSALGRSGVTFSEDQKQAITALVETGKAGDRVTAQQMILKEVNSQVGGAAEAQATSMDKLKVTLGNIAETVGAYLVPALDKGAQFIIKVVESAQSGRIADFASKISGLSKDFDGVRAAASNVFTAIKAVVERVWPGLQETLLALGRVVRGVVGLVTGLLTGDFSKAWEGVKDIFEGGVGVVLSILKTSGGLLLDAAKLLGSLVLKGLEALPGLLFDLAKKAAGKAVDGLKATPGAILDAGKWIIGKVWEGIKAVASFAGDVGGWIKNRVVEGIQAYAAGVREVGGWITNRVEEGLKAVGGFARDAGGWIKNRVVDGVHLFPDDLRDAGGWIVNRVEDGVKAMVNFQIDVGGWIKNRVSDGVRLFADGVREVGGWIVNRVWDGVKLAASFAEDVGGWIKNRVEEGVRKASDFFKDVGGWIVGRIQAGITGAPKRIFDAISDLKDQVVRAVRDVFSDAVSIPLKLKLPSINLPFGGAGGGNVGPGKSGSFGSVQSIADASLSWGLSGGRGQGQAFRPGDPGYHGQGRARDLSGSAAAMMGFAKMIMASMGGRLLELIYTPMGVGIKNGRPVDIRSFYGAAVAADHYDHVHVAMEHGGMVKRGGWAMVGERGPELVKLPSRSSVIPADETRGMLSGGGRGITIIHNGDQVINDRFDEQRFAADLAWKLSA